MLMLLMLAWLRISNAQPFNYSKYESFSDDDYGPQCYTAAPIAEVKARSTLQCSVICSHFQKSFCNIFNYVEDLVNSVEDGSGGKCQVFTVQVMDKNLLDYVDGCSAYGTGNFDYAYITVNSSLCEFPFTYAGQLYYKCTKLTNIPQNMGFYFCLIKLRKLAICVNPFDYMATNKTILLNVPTFASPFSVTSVNDWIVIQQRIDNSLSFNKKWAGYKAGFGSYDANFWFGLEKIYQLTISGNYRVRFEVLGVGIWFSDEYDSFWIDSDPNDYTIHVSGYSGDNLNILNQSVLLGFQTYQNGRPFSTTDRDSSCGCPDINNGGYWLNCCFAQNLNADHKGSFMKKTGKWENLTYSRIMIKLS